MATPLPRPLSHANGCLTFRKLLLTVAPGGHWQANRSSMNPFAIGAARLAALGFTVSGCIPQPWLASAGPRGYRRNESKYQFATDRGRSMSPARKNGTPGAWSRDAQHRQGCPRLRSSTPLTHRRSRSARATRTYIITAARAQSKRVIPSSPCLAKPSF